MWIYNVNYKLSTLSASEQKTPHFLAPCKYYWTVSVSIAEWHKLERFTKNWKHELLCIVRTPATLVFITEELLCVNKKMQIIEITSSILTEQTSTRISGYKSSDCLLIDLSYISAAGASLQPLDLGGSELQHA